MGFSIKKITKGFQKAGKIVSREAVNAAMTPVTLAAKTVSKGLSAAAPVLSQATGILQANPALAGIAGSALGMPGLAGAFSGGGTMGAGDGGGFAAPPPSDAAPAKSTSPWIWVAIAGGALVALFLLFRRKASA